MAIAWNIVDSVPTEEGVLQLRQRGERDFLITVGSQVLMNSSAHRSEIALGQLSCSHLTKKPNPRVLIGGLGMGYTLRAVLDSLPVTSQVVVAELNPVVVTWCRGPLAGLTASAVTDLRVSVDITDVADLIRRSTISSSEQGFDAIVLDLYRGPHFHTDKRDDPLYGSKAIEFTRSALKPGGVLGVWGENYDEGFDKRLRSAGFSVSIKRPGRGGLLHAVFLAVRT